MRSSSTVLQPRQFLGALLLVTILAFFIPLALGVPPGQYTDDLSPVVWLSVLQMLGTAWLCRQIRRIRQGESPDDPATVIWALIAAGFLFLAFDEVFRFHENAALWTRRLLHLPKNGFTARLDDLLIGSYGLVGVVVLYRFRDELRRFRRVLPLIVVGMVLTFGMVALDLITHRRDLLDAWLRDPVLAGRLFLWLGVAEELLKIEAQALFVGAFYGCYYLASKGAAGVGSR